MKFDIHNYRIKADPYQFILFERGDAPEGAADDGEELRGFHPIGHYTTPEGLVRGLALAAGKHKSGRAKTLEEWARAQLAALESVRNSIDDLVAKAVAARARVKARPDMPAEESKS